MICTDGAAAPGALTCPCCGGHCAPQQMTLTLRCAQTAFILVRNVPADVCETCGEAQFSLQTTTQILSTMQAERGPDDIAVIPIYDLASRNR